MSETVTIVSESASASRPYAIHSDTECERLEIQAHLGDMEKHLDRFDLPPNARVLDAGCGSGAMTRLLARRLPQGYAVGIDIRSEYVDFAARRAAAEGLTNLQFQQGDMLALPFPDGSFDVVWSKYVLQWLGDPEGAVRELRRVTRPGGLVVCCNFDGFLLANHPEEEPLQSLLEAVIPRLVDPFVGRKMHKMFHDAGLTEIRIKFEPDRMYTVVGRIDPERRENLAAQFAAARSHIARLLDEAAADRLTADLLAYHDRADTASLCALVFAQGRVPAYPHASSPTLPILF